MDRDRTEGSMKNIKGRVKEGVGKAIGDSKMEAEGKMDKTEGRIQNTIGGMKDSMRKGS
ncbi:CsbD family protein [Microvirga solisilvae]|uniref:CsbD family protein n=1 Tax=Microvirga solisilvae TaxID=2919498 RepID=UPI001FAE9842|nr:CsbD family protein [Microvirga solisilvae]